jgi:hypothetical protein
LPARHPGKLWPQAWLDAGVQQIKKIAIRDTDVLTAELIAELIIGGEYLKLGIEDDQPQARLPEKRHRGLHGSIGRACRLANITSWPHADFIPDGLIEALGKKINANHVTPTIGRFPLDMTSLLGWAFEANP